MALWEQLSRRERGKLTRERRERLHAEYVARVEPRPPHGWDGLSDAQRDALPSIVRLDMEADFLAATDPTSPRLARLREVQASQAEERHRRRADGTVNRPTAHGSWEGDACETATSNPNATSDASSSAPPTTLGPAPAGRDTGPAGTGATPTPTPPNASAGSSGSKPTSGGKTNGSGGKSRGAVRSRPKR